ncbi:MAG: hypothetical protein BGP14_15075 [Sphingobacteriales bacterium 44-15]|nr:MAG: hypothetical protein BGP14_15075 [Sphingobacteriales bacterium 44-15]
MANKVAIITGASGNLGKAVVDKFLAAGYMVNGTVHSGKKNDTDSTNNKYEAVLVDLMDEKSAQQFVDAVIQKHHQIDVAVLTAGGFAMGSIAETKSADILQQYELNFATAYNIARPVFTQMLQQKKGRIFLTGSRPGTDARYSKGMVAYGLSKALLFRLAELMNDEAKGTEVVTSVIVPGTIDTPQNRAAMPDADPTKWVTPESIADIIYYYCSASATIMREPILKVYNGG